MAAARPGPWRAPGSRRRLHQLGCHLQEPGSLHRHRASPPGPPATPPESDRAAAATARGAPCSCSPPHRGGATDPPEAAASEIALGFKRRLRGREWLQPSSGTGPTAGGAADDDHRITVLNPRRLPRWSLPARRVPVGIPGDYKPTLAILPGGEIVMAALFGERAQDGSYREWTPFWRSHDGGRSFSKRVVLLDVLGREQWLTATKGGTLFMSSHFLPQDAANPEGFAQAFLHRFSTSSTGGRSWERTAVAVPAAERCGAPMEGRAVEIATSRNVVELPDGSLGFGVALGDSSELFSL